MTSKIKTYKIEFLFSVLLLITLLFPLIVFFEYGADKFLILSKAYPNLFIFPLFLAFALWHIRPAIQFVRSIYQSNISRGFLSEKRVWAFIILFACAVSYVESKNDGAAWLIKGAHFENTASEQTVIAFASHTHFDLLKEITAEGASVQTVKDAIFSCDFEEGSDNNCKLDSSDTKIIQPDRGKCEFELSTEGQENTSFDFANPSNISDFQAESLSIRKSIANCRLLAANKVKNYGWSAWIYFLSFFAFVVLFGTILMFSLLTSAYIYNNKPRLLPRDINRGHTVKTKRSYIIICTIASSVVVLLWTMMRLICSSNFALIYQNDFSHNLNRIIIVLPITVILLLFVSLIQDRRIRENIGVSLGAFGGIVAMFNYQRIFDVIEYFYVTNLTILSFVLSLMLIIVFSFIPVAYFDGGNADEEDPI